MVLKTAMLDQKSLLSRLANPEDAAWSMEAWMSAEVADRIYQLMYMLSSDPNAKKPEKIKRPGVVNDKADESQFGSDPLPQDEMAQWLGW